MQSSSINTRVRFGLDIKYDFYRIVIIVKAI